MPFLQQALKDIANGTHKLDDGSQTYKAIFVLSTHSYDPTRVYVNDVKSPTDYELTGYTRPTLTGRALALLGSDQCFLSSNTLSLTPTTGQSIGGMYIFRDNGSDSTSKLVAWLPAPGTPVSNGSTITVPCPTNGWLVW